MPFHFLDSQDRPADWPRIEEMTKQAIVDYEKYGFCFSMGDGREAADLSRSIGSASHCWNVEFPLSRSIHRKYSTSASRKMRRTVA